MPHSARISLVTLVLGALCFASFHPMGLATAKATPSQPTRPSSQQCPDPMPSEEPHHSRTLQRASEAQAVAVIRALAGGGAVPAPYPEDIVLELGFGFEVEGTGAAKTKAIADSSPTSVTDGGAGATDRFLATSGTDVNNKLEVSAKASMSYGTFSASVEARFEQKMDRSSRSMTYVTNSHKMFAREYYSSTPTLSKAAREVLDGPGGVKEFKDKYGEYYVFSVERGARLLLKSTIQSTREEMITSLSVQADASGSYGGFSASVSTAVKRDQSITEFSVVEQTGYAIRGVTAACMAAEGPLRGGLLNGTGTDNAGGDSAGSDLSPSELDELYKRFERCAGEAEAKRGGVGMKITLARFDELPEWNTTAWGKLNPINSVLDNNGALRTAAEYVDHYDSIDEDADEFLNLPDVAPDVALKLGKLIADIAAARAKIMAAVPVETEEQLSKTLAEVPFWATFQSAFNRIVGDFRWSSCSHSRYPNGGGGQVTTQSCPSLQTMPVVGGTQCRADWDNMLIYSYSTTGSPTTPGGWFSQCNNHDEQNLNAGSDLYLTCCYTPLLGKCTRIERQDVTSMSCEAGQVLIGAGATCRLSWDAMLYELEPTGVGSVKGRCMNHDDNSQSNPHTMTGYCCTLPSDANATYIQKMGIRGEDTAFVQCPDNSILVNGGITCQRDFADQFILRSYPSTINSWTGYCINHDVSWMQNAPVTASAVCVAFNEDHPQLPTLSDGSGNGNGVVRAVAKETFSNRTGVVVSSSHTRQLAHFELHPPPTSDVKVYYRATCNIDVGLRGSVRVSSDNRCVADLTSGSITIPGGSQTVSIQIVRSPGVPFSRSQNGFLQFSGRTESEDPVWRRSASIFSPIRVVIED